MSDPAPAPAPDYAGLLRLDGRGFLVLGAGRGIGEETARALAAVGARVFCVDVDEKRAREVAREVGGVACCADVTRRDEVERAVEAAEKELGAIAGLVDVVGMARFGSLLEIDDAGWDAQLDVNLRQA